MTATLPDRPELIELDHTACDRVAELVAVRGGHCAGCAGTEFAVGQALYLGYLFLDEDTDVYLVGLTCRNTACPRPRTAIRLRHSEFLAQ